MDGKESWTPIACREGEDDDDGWPACRPAGRLLRPLKLRNQLNRMRRRRRRELRGRTRERRAAPETSGLGIKPGAPEMKLLSPSKPTTMPPTPGRLRERGPHGGTVLYH
ncbi:unnamed protein product [Heligmosomoides polygyrus]|uniref:Uncharacterized protein n=1 Tax=Heligmosomoides polygyrus TaxID=6339 RepID=A0A3P8E230_HELPZ|nr:unnamed protein product [Heligmosomoides polygyrus]